MRFRPWIILTLAIVLAVAVVGCAKKKADLTTADSTAFATNPTEQSAESLATKGQIPPTPPPPAPKAPAPKAKTPTKSATTPKASTPAPAPGVTMPSGTALAVAISNPISSQTAKVGDTWKGVVKNDVVVDGAVVIPAGAEVTGTLTAVKAAAKGDRALLDLAIESVNVAGVNYAAHATTQAIEAGSTRARNLGAIAATTGAGAIIGGAAGGKKGALIGGLIGAAASGGAVAASKGYQVELKEGTELTFSTTESVKIKR